MKKYFFIAILTCITFTIQAQDKTQFSIVGGIQNAATQGDVIGGGFNTGTNYYVGFGSEFLFTSTASLYSELTYSNIRGTSYFQLPVLFKYRFSEKTSFLVGPQIGWVSDKDSQLVESFSIGLSGGLRYEFSNKFYGMLRYTRQFNNHYTGPLDISNKIDMASIGIGFKF